MPRIHKTERLVFLRNGVGKLASHTQRIKVGPLYYTVNIIKLKMDLIIECKVQNCKTSRRKYGGIISLTQVVVVFQSLVMYDSL